MGLDWYKKYFYFILEHFRVCGHVDNVSSILWKYVKKNKEIKPLLRPLHRLANCDVAAQEGEKVFFKFHFLAKILMQLKNIW